MTMLPSPLKFQTFQTPVWASQAVYQCWVVGLLRQASIVDDPRMRVFMDEGLATVYMDNLTRASPRVSTRAKDKSDWNTFMVSSKVLLPLPMYEEYLSPSLETVSIGLWVLAGVDVIYQAFSDEYMLERSMDFMAQNKKQLRQMRVISCALVDAPAHTAAV